MDYLPITVQLKGRACLVVGGGEVAYRKVKHLLKAGAKVSVIALDVSTSLKELATTYDISIEQTSFYPQKISDQYLVIAATNNQQVNEQVSKVAKQRRVWVNVVDDLQLSSFIMPAVIDRSPLLVAISTGGVSPVLARMIREKIEWLLPKNLSNLLNNLKELRPKIKKKYSSLKDKRSFSEWYLEASLKEELQPKQQFEKLVEKFEDNYSTEGKVFLIGAGPGDPELLTVKALKILQKADLVLHDALISTEILELIRKDAKLIHVGKRANKHSKQQAEINQLLVDYAKQGLTVVRLKGGDPFIYGRGGEELETLVEQEIDFEVVPGITAASGCATYAGIPLTHRDHSQALMFITGHCKNSEQNLNWSGIARKNQTLVVYMGLLKNEFLAQQMIKYGRSANTPVAVIENGTSNKQRVVIGCLDQLSGLVEQHQIKSPALIIVGEVVRLAEKLNWYKNNTLITNQTHPAQLYQLKQAV